MSAPRTRDAGATTAVVAMLLTAAGLYFGTGLDGIALLVWIAPIPLLVVALRSSARRAAWLGFAAHALGSLNIAPFLSRVVPLPIVMLAIAIPSLLFMLALLAMRAAVRQGQAWCAPLLFAAIWSGVEFLRALGSPDGTALNLAYSQAAFLPIVQLASITGLWGISFLLCALPAGIACAWESDSRPAALRIVAAPALLLFAALSFGLARLSTGGSGETVRAGAVASDSTVRYFKTTERERALGVIDDYVKRIAALAGQGARVVVLPEKFVGITPEIEPEATERLSRAAREAQVTIVAGFNRIGRQPQLNTALLIEPDGVVKMRYEKQHMLPGFESNYAAGERIGSAAIGGVASSGIAICKDMDFPTTLRRYGAVGTRVMFVPAWDFVVDGPLHARMAIFRGVENGFALVRSAQEGWVSISDDRGRLLAQRSTSEGDDVAIVADLPLGVGKTIYSAAGDWFGWLAVGMAIGGLGLLFLNRRRSAQAA